MIEILIVDTKDTKNRRISINSYGHAKTEVCNAVSTLIQATGNYFYNLATRGRSVLSRILLGDGVSVTDIVIDTDDPTIHTRADTTIEILSLALECLQQEYAREIEMECITDSVVEVSKEDILDCIGEWQKARKIDPEKLHPPDVVMIS